MKLLRGGDEDDGDHDKSLAIRGLDLLIDEHVAILEGYLTRVQLLDILV